MEEPWVKKNVIHDCGVECRGERGHVFSGLCVPGETPCSYAPSCAEIKSRKVFSLSFDKTYADSGIM